MMPNSAFSAIVHNYNLDRLGSYMTVLVGRDTEVALLDRMYSSTEAEFIAVYGRRRIGKTFLINNYFHNKGIYFELTGSKKSSLHEQLKNFDRIFRVFVLRSFVLHTF